MDKAETGGRMTRSDLLILGLLDIVILSMWVNL